MTTVFIVDDHALFRLGTKTFLNTQQDLIRVVGEAENGFDLFYKLKTMEELPDVLLLDIVMPDMSGIEVLIKMREEYPEVKVLMFSAETSFEVLSKLMDIGIDGFISKASPYNDLVGAILTVAEGATYLGGDIAKLINRISIIRKDISNLTDREHQILQYAANGLSAREIAERLQINIRTVDTHKTNIFRKMGFKNSVELVHFAIRYGIIEP